MRRKGVAAHPDVDKLNNFVLRKRVRESPERNKIRLEKEESNT